MKPQSDPSTRAPSAVRLEQYAAELHRFLLRRLRGRQEAEDLLQSIYLRFLQTPHADLVRQPRAYLYRIATNILSEFALRNRRDVVVYDSDAAMRLAECSTAEQVGSDVFGERLALEEQLQRIIGQLPKTYRAVLLMRMLEGLSFAEIGQRCGITEQSARKYLVRAMALCRAADWR